jgi:hypothetical protein
VFPPWTRKASNDAEGLTRTCIGKFIARRDGYLHLRLHPDAGIVCSKSQPSYACGRGDALAFTRIKPSNRCRFLVDGSTSGEEVTISKQSRPTPR